MPYNEVEQNLSRFPATKTEKIVVYCRSGNMSNTAAINLARLGYSNVLDVEGGMLAWEKAGYPLIRCYPDHPLVPQWQPEVAWKRMAETFH